jgi:hypothetical protein
MQKYSIKECDQLRSICKEEFREIRQDWIEAGMWVNPASTRMLRRKHKSTQKRENHHIVDITHQISHRSFVAGFMEGNTSTTRSWFKFAHPDKDLNNFEPVKEWIQNLNRRCLDIGTSTNLYYALSHAYFEYGIFNTACIYINETDSGPNFTVLEAGTYYLMNDAMGIANVLIREFPMTVKTVVESYGMKTDGKVDWSNISGRVKRQYEDGDYNSEVNVCEVIKPNKLFDKMGIEGGSNRKWISLIYEAQQELSDSMFYQPSTGEIKDDQFLQVKHLMRKPFIAFRTQTSGNFPYGLTGPTTNCLGVIKSLNKKAIGKDVALDLMLRPPMQGPASLRKSYLNMNPNGYTALDSNAAMNGGAKPLFQINPAIMALKDDVMDLRGMVKRMYYEDFMLYLSQNPKTRTAAEVNAILSEQQLVIGPALQSLDHTLNNPLVDFLADYAIYEDPYVGPAPEELANSSLKTVFISVFAQAQRAADLPAIDRYVAMIQQVGQLNPTIFDKANLDKLADLYEDRLYLPAGLNRGQDEVDSRREQAQKAAQQNQMMTEQAPAMAGAQKDMAQARALQAQAQQVGQ